MLDLLGVESLSRGGGSCNEDFDRVKATERVELNIELLHDCLLSHALLRMPGELKSFSGFLSLVLFQSMIFGEFTVLKCVRSLHFEVDGQELGPAVPLVIVGLLGDFLDLTGTNTTGNSLDQPFLGRALCFVNSENVLLGALLTNNTLHNAGQIDYVDGGDAVAAVSEDGELGGTLDPGLLEVVVEDALAISVANTRAHNVDLEHGLGSG